MRQRCLNPNNSKYKYYGGRGINIDPKWGCYENFYLDMIGDYKKGLTLGRVDNNGGYSSDNCRWETMRQQNSNKRWNVNIFFKGKTKNLTEWSEYLGIGVGTLHSRLNKLNWSVAKSFNSPIDRRYHNHGK